MLRDFSPQITDLTLPEFSLNWMGLGTQLSGLFLTQKITESRRTGNGCSLSDILEEDVGSRYFLSEKAQDNIRNA